MAMAYRSRQREVEEVRTSEQLAPSRGSDSSTATGIVAPGLPGFEDGGGTVAEAGVRAIEAAVFNGRVDLHGVPDELHTPIVGLQQVAHHQDVPESYWKVGGEARLSTLETSWEALDPWLSTIPKGPARRAGVALASTRRAVRTEWALDEVDVDDALAGGTGDVVGALQAQVTALASTWSDIGSKLLDIDGDALTVGVKNPLDGRSIDADLGMVASCIDLLSSAMDMIREGKGEGRTKLMSDAADMAKGMTELILKGAAQGLEIAGKTEGASGLRDAADLLGKGGGVVVAGLRAAALAVALWDGECSDEDLDIALDLVADVASLAGGGGLGFAISVSWVVFKASLEQMAWTSLHITGAAMVTEVETLLASMTAVSVAHDRSVLAAARAGGDRNGPDFARAADCLAGAVVGPLNSLAMVSSGFRANVLRGAVSGVFALHGKALDAPDMASIHAFCEDLSESVTCVVESLPSLVREEAGFRPRKPATNDEAVGPSSAPLAS